MTQRLLAVPLSKAGSLSDLERFALRCKVGCAPRTGALVTVSVRGAPLQARSGLQATTVSQADRRRSEFPATPLQ